MTASELRRMATPLLETPLIPRDSIADLEMRSRRRRQRASWAHRAGVIAVAAAIVVVFFVPLPHVSLFHNLVAPAKIGTSTNGPIKLPVVDVAATPTGWIPVDLGDAQVSVPRNFLLIYPDQVGTFCKRASASTPGVLLVNNPVGVSTYCPVMPHGTMVFWASVPRPSSVAYEHIEKKSILFSGVRVYRIATTVTYFGYYAPSLGVQVIARGPLAQRILATLTRSPRTVALATGPAPSVPASWRKLSFQGLAFAAPAEWPVEHTPTYYRYFGPTMCPGMTSNHVTPLVILSTDKSSASCFTGASSLPTPRDGLEIASELGNATVKALALVFSTHCFNVNDLRVCPATSPAYSILVLKVTVPGRSKPVYVSIGLAGNGMVARTILYSLRAA